MNLFEHQARLDVRASRAGRMGGAEVARFIAAAGQGQCLAMVEALALRVSELEGIAFGLDNVAEQLGRTLEREPCTCASCDACLAAASDARHDRGVDARLLERASWSAPHEAPQPPRQPAAPPARRKPFCAPQHELARGLGHRRARLD